MEGRNPIHSADIHWAATSSKAHANTTAVDLSSVLTKIIVWVDKGEEMTGSDNTT